MIKTNFTDKSLNTIKSGVEILPPNRSIRLKRGLEPVEHLLLRLGHGCVRGLGPEARDVVLQRCRAIGLIRKPNQIYHAPTNFSYKRV